MAGMKDAFVTIMAHVWLLSMPCSETIKVIIIGSDEFHCLFLIHLNDQQPYLYPIFDHLDMTRFEESWQTGPESRKVFWLHTSADRAMVV